MRVAPFLIQLAVAYRFDYAFSFHGFFVEKIYPDIARVSSFNLKKKKRENSKLNIDVKTHFLCLKQKRVFLKYKNQAYKAHNLFFVFISSGQSIPFFRKTHFQLVPLKRQLIQNELFFTNAPW